MSNREYSTIGILFIINWLKKRNNQKNAFIKRSQLTNSYFFDILKNIKETESGF